jgi:membrane fusion protein (multidrug efflux system)
MTPADSTGGPGVAEASGGWITLLRLIALGCGVLVVFVIAQHWDRWIGSADSQQTDDAYLQTDITPVGAKVSGYVLESPIDDFATVHRGQLLLSLVPDDYRAQLGLQEAGVAAAMAALSNNAAQANLQQANILAARAALANASAVMDRNRREALRQRRLYSDGAGTEQAQENAETSDQQSSAQVEQSRAQVAAAERQLQVLAAQRRQAEAALAAAQAGRDAAALNLSYTRIIAPNDGVVGARQVRVGQFLAAGQQVAVVAALPNIWVLANFKENQIRNMHPGQPCRIEVDAFPGHSLKGHVVGFAPGTGSQFALLPPDNATGNFTKVVQRVGVKIAIDDTGDLRDKLRPGLSVIASVSTSK